MMSARFARLGTVLFRHYAAAAAAAAANADKRCGRRSSRRSSRVERNG